MSHITTKSAYKSLEERLNRFPQGAPPSETLYKILQILFSEKEASLVAQLPIKPFTAKKAAKIWGVSYSEALKTLEGLADRCILLDIETNGDKKYILPPPMAGFLEFSMMRTRQDIDQVLLGELFHQYMNVEEDFVRELFLSTETRMGKTFVNEQALSPDNQVEILDYDKSTHVIDSASHIAVGMCYCRHKMEHVGKACDAPMDICLTFGNVARSLSNRGYARSIDKSEAKDLLNQAYDHNLVQCGENVKNDVAFICNCCGCCCEALVAVKKFGSLNPIETTSFIPTLNEHTCISCGKCEKYCPVDVIEMKQGDTKSLPEIDKNICLGCGVCVRACPNGSLLLKKRDKKIITPETSVHRAVMMAIDKGMLQELIFDNKALYSHRSMAAILSSILNMSPVRKAMASEQMKSKYLGTLITRFSK